MKVLVVQKGAREHFLAARALSKCGALAGLVTDLKAPRSQRLRRWLGNIPSALVKRWLASEIVGVPEEKVITMGWAVVPIRTIPAVAAKFGKRYDGYVASDRLFARAVAKLRLPEHDAVFAYSYAAKEVLEVAQRRGIFTILDQIDPGPVEADLVEMEMARWPDYVKTRQRVPEHYWNRLRAEWKLADLILVNSRWSREALLKQGVDADKIKILPLAYEVNPPIPASDFRRLTSGPLIVLWLGQVCIRKGIQYLVEAARILKGRSVRFIVAGPIEIARDAIRAAPDNIEWVGPVVRDEVSSLYRRADLFVLPTISDGFAITQLEAMAHGVPVIATPRCGEVVVDGLTGHLVPACDGRALAAAIQRFIDDRGLSGKMREACLQRAKEFNLDAYASRLLRLLGAPRQNG
jgi:glycosyltransferase involved in cell wall biosynthesis